jgi:hypothetical protein
MKSIDEAEAQSRLEEILEEAQRQPVLIRRLQDAAVACQSLNIYTHVVDASHRAAIEQLERQLFPTVPKSEEADNEPESGSARN